MASTIHQDANEIKDNINKDVNETKESPKTSSNDISGSFYKEVAD
jgi:hypothetical protein